ncbi:MULTISPECIES: oligosaccharide flippase family protein [Bacillaceae]|uniref:oligosaccharide flippase family protein n=2 Tax=Bacillales TaxID=1385 RepID=UPI0006609412|nr:MULTISPECIES: oligosaccharide flippase family protein [Bacillaceae]MCF7623646.1 oligosaccharide flippase family protein [Peribacillus frigoritolerans]
MNNYKKLVNNSLIFAVGNLGTKLIVFFLVPLYTYYLTKTEFGMVDLLTSTLSFLMPIFSLCIFDSVLRFAMDNNYDKQAVLANSLVVTFIGFVLSFLIYPILIYILPFDDFILYFYLLLFVQSINTILTQYVRAIGMVKLFACSGLINAFILLVCNIFLLMLFPMGIVGYLFSLVIANIFSSLFVIIGGKVQNDFNVKKINIKLTKEMLLYSIPLIPNALMWWIMGLSDRFIITYFLGLSANGLYAVANKIPSILNIINSIFFQAWQMSAIEEVDSKDKSKFFSNVFNVFSIAMLVSTSLLLILLKIIMKFFVADNYFDAWQYVPFLLLGVVFSSFSGFLGTNYIAAKKTSGVFKTSVIGAIINIVANVILIPIIGINGASIGTMLSFAVIWLLRIKDTREFVKVEINIKKMVFTLIALIVQIGLLYMNLAFECLFQIIIFIIIILINQNEMKDIIIKIMGFLSKRKIQSK